jgi:hypothetical protein
MLRNGQSQASSWFSSSLDEALKKLLLVVFWDTWPRVFAFEAQGVFVYPFQSQCDRASSGVLDAVSREERGVSTLLVESTSLP